RRGASDSQYLAERNVSRPDTRKERVGDDDLFGATGLRVVTARFFVQYSGRERGRVVAPQRHTGTVRRMPEASVNGVRLAYDVHGEGEPVLMVCATGQPAFSWTLSVVPALNAA